MLLAIDIGNSTIKFGIFSGSELVHKFSIPTVLDYDPDELMFERFRYVKERFIRIDTVVASSVVPSIEPVLTGACKEFLNVTPVFVTNVVDLGLTIKYDPPESLGTDRLVSGFSAAETHGKPVVVCSFGTATTIDAISSNGEFLGGVIFPGVGTMSHSLQLKTSKLPLVQISKPDRVVGTSTESSIRSGIFHGHIGAAKYLIKAIAAEMKDEPKIVATGGYAKMMASELAVIKIVDENLLLNGLRMIHERIV